MLTLILAAQIVTVFAVIFLLLRKPVPAQQDPRLTQLAETLPTQLTRLDAHFEGLDHHLRNELAQLRTENAAEANRTREDSAASATTLRHEVIGNIATLGQALKQDLQSFRDDNAASATALRTEVEQKMHSISQSFSDFKSETGQKHSALQESLNTKLVELMGSNTTHQNQLRATVEARLDKLNTDNEAKLEQMRVTVDEKLQSTLHDRLTQSFSQVTDQLNKVHSGLGEMAKLSEGVDGLSRIFTNVKSRGGFAEVQLGMLLDQILAPGQYIENAVVKQGSSERVEFAVRFPGRNGETLLPIDSKFPLEDWQRLESAYAANDPEKRDQASKAFETAVRKQAKLICAKYINSPTTTPFALMFLPTEGLYAEIMRRDALQAEIQTQCNVTIVGPSTLFVILTSYRMGFNMLAFQEKGDEVWKILQGAKTEFNKFGTLMDKVEGDVNKIQKTLGEVGVRTRAINRTLREVSDSASSQPTLLEFQDFAAPDLSLAASADNDE
jgi:DNA recombination protein RmuC